MENHYILCDFVMKTLAMPLLHVHVLMNKQVCGISPPAGKNAAKQLCGLLAARVPNFAILALLAS